MPDFNIYMLGTCMEPGYPGVDWARRGNSYEKWDAVDEFLKNGGDPAKAPNQDITHYSKKRKSRKPKWSEIDCVNMGPGVGVSDRARIVIESLGVPGTMFLPFTLDGAPFHVFTTSRVVDCLDREKSVLRFFDDDRTRVMSIDAHRFHRDQLNDPDVFTIPENIRTARYCWRHFYVTEEVRHAVESSKLVGFHFFELEDNRNPMGSGGPPENYLQAELGLRLSIPDTWTFVKPARKRRPRGNVSPIWLDVSPIPVETGAGQHLLTAQFQDITWPGVKSHASIEINAWRTENCEECIREVLSRGDDPDARTGKCRVGGLEFEYVRTGNFQFLLVAAPSDPTVCLEFRVFGVGKLFPVAWSVFETLSWEPND